MSGIGVCDVKFPKINKMNHVEKAKDLEILCNHLLLSIAYREIQNISTNRTTNLLGHAIHHIKWIGI